MEQAKAKFEEPRDETLTHRELPRYMTTDEIRIARPAALDGIPASALVWSRRQMTATGQWNAGQLMGRRWPIGCVALEITQRCNLDCAACYLSENSEAVRDLPLTEVFRRIDMIYEHYGPDTDVQVTGGDPTLRQRVRGRWRQQPVYPRKLPTWFNAQVGSSGPRAAIRRREV